MKQRQWMLTLAASAMAMMPAIASADMHGKLESLEAQLQALKSQMHAHKNDRGGFSAHHVDVTALDEEDKGQLSSVMSKHFVVTKDNNLSVGLYGHVNRAFLMVDDDYDHTFAHVDNDHSSTRIGIYGVAEVNPDLHMWADIQVQMESNSNAAINQVNPSSGSVNFTDRKLQFIMDHKQYGKVSFGQGSMASDGTGELSLAMTDDVSYGAPADMAAGFYFRNPAQKSNTLLAANTATTPTVGNVFDHFDGLGRDDRIRYDSPVIMGFKLSGSFAGDNSGGQIHDVALRHYYNNDVIKWKAAAAYAEDGTDTIKDGSIAVLHKPTGLSFAFATGYKDFATRDRNTASIRTFTLGYQKVFCPNWGLTAFAIDYSKSDDQYINGDEATAVGGGVEQHIDDFNTKVYFGVRHFDYDHPTINYDDLFAAMIGAKVSF